MFKLFKYFKWYDWLMTVITVALVVGQAWTALQLPQYMANIIGLFQASTDPITGIVTPANPTAAALWSQAGLMLMYVGISTVLAIVSMYLAARISANLSKNLRRMQFEKVASFSMEEMNSFSTPSLITRSTNDITQIQQVMTMILRLLPYAPTLAIIAIIKIVGADATLSAVTAVAIVVLIAVIIFMIAFVLPRFKSIQKLVDRLNGVTRENLTGIRVVRATDAEKIQEEKFSEANINLTRTNTFVTKIMALLLPVMTLIMGALSTVIYWISAGMINNGTLLYQSVAMFSQYSVQIIMGFLVIAMLFVMYPRGQVSANRVMEVLNTKSKIKEGNLTAEDLKDIKLRGELEFKNVNFKYPNAEGYVLKNLNFKVQGGQTVAFIGSTGSGKSTLINLIPRFYDATEGEVLVDGTNVKDYKAVTLNDKLGYVPQKGILFNGSVRDNVKYGDENATDEEINHALKVAQASGFVAKLDGGLDYHIAQGGKNVSGGQRQRLSIARAIIRKPEIYIFDDSFSALDYKTDRNLRTALKKETNKATNLIVAQRVGSIMDADQIVVLDKGEIVGMGTHRELLKNCKIYKEIAYSQLSKEELENE